MGEAGPPWRHAAVQRNDHRVSQRGWRARGDGQRGRRSHESSRRAEGLTQMALKVSETNVGDSRSRLLTHDLTRTQIVMYAGASGDYNPLHTDEVFTTQVAGYPSVFAHGMLSMGMTGRALTDWVGDGRLTKYGVRFSKQVWPGDALTALVTVEAIRDEGGTPFADFSIVTRNQKGEDVVVGSASARLDP